MLKNTIKWQSNTGNRKKEEIRSFRPCIDTLAGKSEAQEQHERDWKWSTVHYQDDHKFDKVLKRVHLIEEWTGIVRGKLDVDYPKRTIGGMIKNLTIPTGHG